MSRKYVLIPLMMIGFMLCSGCVSSKTDTGTSLAKPYQVIRAEERTLEDVGGRTTGFWTITSQDASNYEEFAQTSIQAVCDLYELYHKDFTSVDLISSDEFQYSYCQANYAADGKGPLGLTGSAPAVESYWRVWVADRPLNQQERAILTLWREKQSDFPITDPIRRMISGMSSPYDEVALRQYIADELKLDYVEVQFPIIHRTEYKASKSLP